MRSVLKKQDEEALIVRVESLEPDDTGLWGSMTPHQAICHLNDSYLAALGPRPVKAMGTWRHRTYIRLFAFTLPMPWPRGVPTHPQWDQAQGGTRPEQFDVDRERLVDLIRRFSGTGGQGLDAHPVFGNLSAGEWGRWGWRHVDHHLRQFGR